MEQLDPNVLVAVAVMQQQQFEFDVFSQNTIGNTFLLKLLIFSYLSTIWQWMMLSIQFHKHWCMFSRTDKDHFTATRTDQWQLNTYRIEKVKFHIWSVCIKGVMIITYNRSVIKLFKQYDNWLLKNLMFNQLLWEKYFFLVGK